MTVLAFLFLMDLIYILFVMFFSLLEDCIRIQQEHVDTNIRKHSTQNNFFKNADLIIHTYTSCCSVMTNFCHDIDDRIMRVSRVQRMIATTQHMSLARHLIAEHSLARLYIRHVEDIFRHVRCNFTLLAAICTYIIIEEWGSYGNHLTHTYRNNSLTFH